MCQPKGLIGVVLGWTGLWLAFGAGLRGSGGVHTQPTAKEMAAVANGPIIGV